MKPIARKDFVKAVREGKADAKTSRQALLNQTESERREKIDSDIDDREPMDRVADELVAFTKAVQDMTQTQAQTLMAVLKTLLEAISEMGQQNKAVQVDISDTRPREWNVEVEKRDRNGMIESVKLVAGREETVQ